MPLDISGLIEQRARELARENEIVPWFMLPSYIKTSYREKARATLEMKP